MKQKTLADIIQEKIPLGKLNARGFYQIKCAKCNDYQERGGFRFDGDSTGYSCWNCGSKARYTEGTGNVSENFKQILAAFGIENLEELTSPIFLKARIEEKEKISLQTLTKLNLNTPEVQFPECTYPLLSSGNEELQEPLLEYLLARHINPLQHQLYFSTSPKLLRRVILPCWRNQKLIFWQARAIDDIKRRYLSCGASKEAVLYGYDELHKYETAPLFCTEGIFNAMLINGISILGSSLNPTKIEILKRTRRRLIFVIDRDRTGGELGKSVLENEWELTFVDIRAKDINDSVVKFGLPYTAWSLIKNATVKGNSIQSNAMLSIGLLEARLRNG